MLCIVYDDDKPAQKWTRYCPGRGSHRNNGNPGGWIGGRGATTVEVEQQQQHRQCTDGAAGSGMSRTCYIVSRQHFLSMSRLEDQTVRGKWKPFLFFVWERPPSGTVRVLRSLPIKGWTIMAGKTYASGTGCEHQPPQHRDEVA